MTASSNQPPAGSLLEGIELPPPLPASATGAEGAGKRRLARAERPFLPPILRDNRVNRWVKRHRRVSIAALALVLVGVGLWAWDRYRFHPPPDYATADMEDLLDYTFITDDFNKLPIEKRLELIRELVRRFGAMEGSESVAMAEFAAMIEGDLRKQMMKNASLLAIDMWDGYAAAYTAVPPEERGKFLDDTVVNFLKTMESFDPNGPRNISDADRLAEARRQAQRDKSAIRSGQMSSGQLGQMADFMRNGVGQFAAPQTQVRAAQLMRDMTRHLRGQDGSGSPGAPAGGGR